MKTHRTYICTISKRRTWNVSEEWKQSVEKEETKMDLRIHQGREWKCNREREIKSREEESLM